MNRKSALGTLLTLLLLGIIFEVLTVPTVSAQTVPTWFSVSVFASQGLSSPNYLEFGPGGVFGTELYVSEGGSGEVSKVSPGGGVSTFVTGISTASGLAFSLNDPWFGTFLYVGTFAPTIGYDIYRADPSQSVFPFSSGPGVGPLEFGPGVTSAGNYGTNLYVGEIDPGSGFTRVAGVDYLGSRGSASLTKLFEEFRGLAFDRYGFYGGLLYVSDSIYGKVYQQPPPGSPLSIFAPGVMAEGLQFSPGGAFCTNLYAAGWNSGEIYSISPSGSYSVWGSGFGTPSDIAFATSPPYGPAMYVADTTGNKIYKIFPTSPQWAIEDVPGTVGGWHSSIVVDSNGNTQISYVDTSTSNPDLKFAFKNGLGSWTLEPVHVTANDVGQFNSIALDSQGRPAVSYYDAANGNLMYAYRNLAPPTASSWTQEVADEGNVVSVGADVGYFSSLAFDKWGYPHIAYEDRTNMVLMHAYRFGTLWIPQGPPVATYLTLPLSDTSIASNPIDGTLHISYLIYMASLFYVKGTPDPNYPPGLIWDWPPQPHEMVDQEEAGGTENDITLDSAGNPHISYYDPDSQKLKHAWWNGGQWQKEFVDDASGSTSIAFDSSANVLHISYLYNNRLRHAWKNLACTIGPWHTETVDPNTNVNGRTSIGLDPFGYPHISYYDSSSDRLMHAFAMHSTASVQTATGTGTATFTTTAGGFAHLEVINPTASYLQPLPSGVNFPDGLFSLTIEGLTPGQTVTITITLPTPVPTLPTPSYWKYHAGTGWFPLPIGDNDGDNVITITLTDGPPNTSTGDFDNSQNGIIVDPGGVGVNPWIVTTVDAAGVVRSPSIALDSNNLPHISYLDWWRANLEYARLDSGGWHFKTVDYYIGLESDRSLALDSNNYPHIVYVGQGGLTYAWEDSGGWHFTIVDSAFGIGRYASLGLDSSGRAHIGYFDEQNGRFKYAYQTSPGGPFAPPEIVDSGAGIGWYSSMALGPNNLPQVSYWDGGSWKLKYAWRDASGQWWRQTVPDAGAVGDADTSIAVDANNNPHISYREINFALQHAYQKYATYDGSGWTIEYVDMNGGWGSTSIAVDGNNIPAISYIQWGTGYLMYSKRTSGVWGSPMVVDATPSGDVSLALEPVTGNAHISYYNDRDIKYAYEGIPPSTMKVQTGTGTGMATFTTSDGGFTLLEAIDPPSYPPDPSNYPPTPWGNVMFPDGLFRFRIALPAGVTQVTITITLPSSYPSPSKYYKYDSGTGQWVGWIPRSLPSPSNTVVITLHDGVFPEDFTGAGDGIIEDPGGPGIPPLAATLDIDPDTLNLLTKGEWLTAYIQLPEDYNAADIDASAILLNGTIAPELDPKYSFVTNPNEYLLDHNNDGIVERMVKFNREDVANFVRSKGIYYGTVTFTVTGHLTDGTPLRGMCTIMVRLVGSGARALFK